MSSQVGDCFKYLWPFQNVLTLLPWTPKRHLNYVTFRQGEREGAQWSDLAPFFFEILINMKSYAIMTPLVTTKLRGCFQFFWPTHNANNINYRVFERKT